MLTTTVDGLWVLQVLTGIEVIAPELGLRPHLPSVEPKQLALAHAVTVELRAQGVVDESGEVDATVVDWLTVLSRRDIALLVQFRPPGERTSARALLARYAKWWVVMERSADLIQIRGAGTATAEGSANAMINTQIERVCGSQPPAPLRPVTLDRAAVRAEVTSLDTLGCFLAKQRLEPDQLRLLTLAADSQRSTQASIVAIQCGVDSGRPTRSHIDENPVTIIDTPEGRLVAEHVVSAGNAWVIVAPGTANSAASAINRMVRRLPAHEKWYSYRRAV